MKKINSIFARREFVLGGIAIAGSTSFGLSGCGSGEEAVIAKNSYALKNLAATDAKYQAKYTLPGMIDAWGIAIRPAGAGGHFWVGGAGTSWQFLGDVKNHSQSNLRELTVDQLTEVYPAVSKDAAGERVGFVTGVIYNGAPIWGGTVGTTKFPVSPSLSTSPQVANGSAIEGSARFIFASDSGQLSAWSERRADNGEIVRVNGNTQTVYDGEAAGHAYFGLAINPETWSTLWVADFGAQPQIRQFDSQWRLVPTVGFINPFAGISGVARPGDFVPFNLTVVGNRVFVAYAKSQPDPADPNAFYAAEEDAMSATDEKASGYKPDKGRLVEFNLSGGLVKIFDDDKRLNAPWGVAIAPANFGEFSNAVLVGNFGGAGLIMAYSSAGQFIGFLQDAKGEKIAVEGLWGLLFGNGASLGDTDALYFAAGPADETEGVFGSLRYAP